MARIVVALGGNALSLDGKATAAAQQAVARQTADQLIKLIADGHELVVVHGNGPQIGNIILHEEAINTEKTPTMPVDVCGAMSQGQIGYWLQNALEEKLKLGNLPHTAVTLVTQVLVDPKDPAFSHPTKPIGPFYTEEEAKRLAIERKITVKEDAGRGWRKVVPSPLPVDIIEIEAIKTLLSHQTIVISAGGGGIPVYREGHRLVGLEAVIDKDFAAAKLSSLISADILLILTAVDTVKINFGKPDEQPLSSLSPSLAADYIKDGQFSAGSMLPKIEAALEFAKQGGTTIITSPTFATLALKGQAGTKITPS